MITWPAIIQYAGDAELSYLPGEAAYLAEQQAGRFSSADRLIDAAGQVYRLPPGNGQPAMPLPSGQTAALEEVLALVRAHASQAGSCCVAKLHAASIAEALALAAD